MADFFCTDETGAKYWLVWSAPSSSIRSGQYGYVQPDQVVSTGQDNLETFDTEAQLSSRVDTLKGESGWYMKEENRIVS